MLLRVEPVCCVREFSLLNSFAHDTRLPWCTCASASARQSRAQCRARVLKFFCASAGCPRRPFERTESCPDDAVAGGLRTAPRRTARWRTTAVIEPASAAIGDGEEAAGSKATRRCLRQRLALLVPEQRLHSGDADVADPVWPSRMPSSARASHAAWLRGAEPEGGASTPDASRGGCGCGSGCGCAGQTAAPV